ncbi:MAG: DUF6149 family protein [Halobacteriales archaeon]|nr:DUF6149 family protein [Halobacteriales archaeon]
MKIRQNVRHFAARAALSAPVIGDIANDRLVDLHTEIFLDRAEKPHREDRREHLDAFFDCTMDTYLTALQEGYTEAEAREITHIQANFDFYNHGWTEMMEFPSEELEAHYDRYAEFFEAHDISVADPLGEFRVREIPDAPSTPEKLDRADHPNAEGGFADDVYVEGPDGEIRVGGQSPPEEIDVTDAPGIDPDDIEDATAE